MPKGKKYDTEEHHIQPSSLGWSDDPVNLIRLPKFMHKWLHLLFANRWPKDQLFYLANIINGKAHTKKFKQELNKLLAEDDTKIFNKNVIWQIKSKK